MQSAHIRKRSAVAGIVASCVIAVWALVTLTLRPDGASQVSRVTQAPFDGVYIEPGLSLTVKPFPTGSGDLTAAGAWAMWESGWLLPADVTARFGLLDDQGRYHQVWAYREPSTSCLRPHRHFSHPRDPPCRDWVFLAPRTGRLVLGIGGFIG